MSIDEALGQWQRLSAQVQKSSVNPVVAKAFDDLTGQFALGLDEVRQLMFKAGQLHGLGNFRCADQLTAGLRDLATGQEGSMMAVLNQMMAVSKLMSETVGTNVAKVVAHDDQLAASLKQIRPGE